MTPSTIPNRDSIPQNHPNPKEAVSNLDGAAVSMGGWLFCISLDSTVADCPLARATVLFKESVSMAIDIMNMVTFFVGYRNL